MKKSECKLPQCREQRAAGHDPHSHAATLLPDEHLCQRLLLRVRQQFPGALPRGLERRALDRLPRPAAGGLARPSARRKRYLHAPQPSTPRGRQLGEAWPTVFPDERDGPPWAELAWPGEAQKCGIERLALQPGQLRLGAPLSRHPFTTLVWHN